MTYPVVLAVSFVLAAVRVAVLACPELREHRHFFGGFQATAHLWVGGLFVAGWHGWGRATWHDRYWLTAAALSLLEGVAGLVTVAVG